MSAETVSHQALHVDHGKPERTLGGRNASPAGSTRNARQAGDVVGRIVIAGAP